MANKKILMGMLALTFGLVLSGCENSVQEVEGSVSIKPDKAPAPGNVTVELSNNSSYSYIYIGFDAVDNASGYRGYIREKGMKLVQPITLSSLTEHSPGKLACTISIPISTSSSYTSGETYEIGIQTSGLITGGELSSGSDIVWKEFTISRGFTFSNYSGYSATVYALTSNPSTVSAAMSAIDNYNYAGYGTISSGGSVTWSSAPSSGTYTLLVIDSSSNYYKIPYVSIGSSGSGSADWSNRTSLGTGNPDPGPSGSSFTLTGYSGSYPAGVYALTSNPSSLVDATSALSNAAGTGQINSGTTVTWVDVPSSRTYTLLIMDTSGNYYKITNVSIGSNGSGSASWSSRTSLSTY